MSRAQQIREQVSCFEALELLGIEEPNAEGKVLCWMHDEDTPSVHIYEDHWWAYCCGRGGSVIDLVMSYTGASFGRACRFLAGAVDELATTPRVVAERRQSEVDLTDRFERETQHLWEGDTSDVERLITRRWPALTLHDLVDFGVRRTRWALWIPHFNAEGKVVGVKTRAITTGEKKAVKGSTFPRLYGLDGPGGPVLLCEGESDTWTARRYLPKRWSALGLPSGAGTWRPEYTEQLEGREVVLGLDADEAGRKAAASIRQRLEGHAVAIGELALWGAKDICEAVGNGARFVDHPLSLL